MTLIHITINIEWHPVFRTFIIFKPSLLHPSFSQDIAVLLSTSLLETKTTNETFSSLSKTSQNQNDPSSPDYITQVTGSPQSLTLQLHSLVTGAAALYMFGYFADLFGFGWFRPLVYTVCVGTALLVSLCTIGANNGKPPFSGGKDALLGYVGRVQQGAEFNWLFFSMVFVTVDPIMLVVVILARRSLWATIQ